MQYDTFSEDESTDEIPVIVQVKTGSQIHEERISKGYILSSEEKINLQYLQSYPYECTFSWIQEKTILYQLQSNGKDTLMHPTHATESGNLKN